jgi:predicted transcriptional regulator
VLNLSANVFLNGLPDNIPMLKVFEKSGLRLNIERDAGVVHTGEADEARETEARKRILAAMGEIGEAAGPKDIADYAGVKLSNAKFHLNKLVQEGLVVKPQRGKYGCPTNPLTN